MLFNTQVPPKSSGNGYFEKLSQPASFTMTTNDPAGAHFGRIRTACTVRCCTHPLEVEECVGYTIKHESSLSRVLKVILLTYKQNTDPFGQPCVEPTNLETNRAVMYPHAHAQGWSLRGVPAGQDRHTLQPWFFSHLPAYITGFNTIDVFGWGALGHAVAFGALGIASYVQ